MRLVHLTDGPADQELSFHTSLDNKVAGLTGEMLRQKLCLQEALKSKIVVRRDWQVFVLASRSSRWLNIPLSLPSASSSCLLHSAFILHSFSFFSHSLIYLFPSCPLHFQHLLSIAGGHVIMTQLALIAIYKCLA